MQRKHLSKHQGIPQHDSLTRDKNNKNNTTSKKLDSLLINECSKIPISFIFSSFIKHYHNVTIYCSRLIGLEWPYVLFFSSIMNLQSISNTCNFSFWIFKQHLSIL